MSANASGVALQHTLQPTDNKGATCNMQEADNIVADGIKAVVKLHHCAGRNPFAYFLYQVIEHIR